MKRENIYKLIEDIDQLIIDLTDCNERLKEDLDLLLELNIE